MRAALPLALVACLHLAAGPARAQTPDAEWCAQAPPDAGAEELARRLRLCAHVLRLYAARLAILEHALDGLLAGGRVGVPAGEVSRDATPEPKEAR